MDGVPPWWIDTFLHGPFVLAGAGLVGLVYDLVARRKYRRAKRATK